MSKSHQVLLVVDGIVNLGLGLLLLLVPLGSAEVFAAPRSNSDFYPTILGGVLLGIGIALFIERYGHPRGMRGLGLHGAIAINLCGATVLLVWLLTAPPDIPTRGTVLLWGIVVLVYCVGLIELLLQSRGLNDPENDHPRRS